MSVRRHGLSRPPRREAIPLEARVLAAVDAYSAMNADRPYRTARDHDDALRELRAAAGTQLDPMVVDALIGALQPVAV